MDLIQSDTTKKIIFFQLYPNQLYSMSNLKLGLKHISLERLLMIWSFNLNFVFILFVFQWFCCKVSLSEMKGTYKRY